MKVGFPYKECDACNRLDVLLLHELKETFCHLSQVIESFHIYIICILLDFINPLGHKLNTELGFLHDSQCVCQHRTDLFQGLRSKLHMLCHFPHEAL